MKGPATETTLAVTVSRTSMRPDFDTTITYRPLGEVSACAMPVPVDSTALDPEQELMTAAGGGWEPAKDWGWLSSGMSARDDSLLLQLPVVIAEYAGRQQHREERRLAGPNSPQGSRPAARPAACCGLHIRGQGLASRDHGSSRVALLLPAGQLWAAANYKPARQAPGSPDCTTTAVPEPPK
jgi:hypothetical protein